MLSDNKYEKEVHGHEVYTSLEKSKKRNKAKKLIIGDSTANQLYNTETDTSSVICTLACNQAIGVVGHFILLTNYLTAGNRPNDVYLIYNPLGYWDNLDQVYTYHYFLKPFYKKEYKQFFSENVNRQIHKIPYNFVSQFPPILISSWSPEIKEEKRPYTFLSPISKEYLEKIDSLCKKHKIRLHFVSPFMSEYWRDTISHFNLTEIEGRSYTNDFSNYINDIIYVDDSCFSDHLHLKEHNLTKFKKIIEKKILN